ncbi:hypothetical protein GUJ93_ZPchr0002g23802 [Zizania palustris]|uniref:Uncharacterized protein n=1 Tax=Zizania palustris TaxID=103762 RepID=A0A8J5V3H8_ZIZPA|nr:hypothetical protein GUJ93_ZPchr0002g23802 [Zizania palustris]
MQPENDDDPASDQFFPTRITSPNTRSDHILKIDDEFDNGLKKKITQSSNLSKTVDGVTKAFEIRKKKEALYQQIMAVIPEELQGIDGIVDNLQDAYNAGLHIGTDDEEDEQDE